MSEELYEIFKTQIATVQLLRDFDFQENDVKGDFMSLFRWKRLRFDCKIMNQENTEFFYFNSECFALIEYINEMAKILLIDTMTFGGGLSFLDYMMQIHYGDKVNDVFRFASENHSRQTDGHKTNFHDDVANNAMTRSKIAFVDEDRQLKKSIV